jgi:hypothetical protein
MESPSSSRGAEAGETETEDPVRARPQQLQHEKAVQHASTPRSYGSAAMSGHGQHTAPHLPVQCTMHP